MFDKNDLEILNHMGGSNEIEKALTFDRTDIQRLAIVHNKNIFFTIFACFISRIVS